MATQKVVDTNRMLNLGATFTSKSHGEITVYELPLIKVLKLAPDLAKVFSTYYPKLASLKAEGTPDESANLVLLAELLSNPSSATLLCKLGEASTSLPSSAFENLSVTDWLKIVEKFLEVNSFDELQELFKKVMKAVNYRIQDTIPESLAS